MYSVCLYVLSSTKPLIFVDQQFDHFEMHFSKSDLSTLKYCPRRTLPQICVHTHTCGHTNICTAYIQTHLPPPPTHLCKQNTCTAFTCIHTGTHTQAKHTHTHTQHTLMKSPLNMCAYTNTSFRVLSWSCRHASTWLDLLRTSFYTVQFALKERLICLLFLLLSSCFFL